MDCPDCEAGIKHVHDCPAGGAHEWEEHDSGDAYGPIGGGPGTRVIRWMACANCHAPMPDQF